MNRITNLEVKEIALSIGVTFAHLKTIMNVESGSYGFDPKTNLMMIQFEPVHFSQRSGIPRSTTNQYTWDENKVDIQPREREAFSEAFRINPNAAMESTSIGLPQIMGFHWKLLGYASVGEMWDDFKVSEYNQVKGLAKFIKANPVLLKALLSQDWNTVASIYNGKNYMELAKQLGTVPYNTKLANEFEKQKNVII